jgi:ABC-type sugar transport system substrate-binding protein
MKEKYPDTEVHLLTIEWVADNVNKMMRQALTQNPNITGVFSDDDQMVPGVLSALRRTGKLVPVGQ